MYERHLVYSVYVFYITKHNGTFRILERIIEHIYHVKRVLIGSWYRVSLLALKRPARGTDHPPPSSVERQKSYSCTSPPPPCALMAYCSVTGAIVIYAATLVTSLNDVLMEELTVAYQVTEISFCETTAEIDSKKETFLLRNPKAD